MVLSLKRRGLGFGRIQNRMDYGPGPTPPCLIAFENDFVAAPNQVIVL